MNKKILIVILLVAIIASLVAVWGRYRAEKSANGVELIMDFKTLSQLDVEMDQYLSDLKDNGLTAVGVYPETLLQLVNQGDARLLNGNELHRSMIRTGAINPELDIFPFDGKSAFIIVDKEYSKQLEKALPEWSEEYEINYEIKNDKVIIFFKKWNLKYLNLNLGFNQDFLAMLKEKGIKIVPRLDNNLLSNELNWKLMDELSPYVVIFDGAKVTGYKHESKEGLRKTARVMRENYIIFGMIEEFIARQLGADSLSYYLDFNILRTHSIQQVEMDRRRDYSTEKIVDRYLRAVRERNVRLLYLKPFLVERDDVYPQKLTLDFIKKLSSELKSAGYNPGSVQTFNKYKNENYLLLLTSLGIMLGGIYLIELLTGIKIIKYSWAILLVGLIFEVSILLVDKEFFLRKILALASVIVFPSLAVITQLLSGQKKRWLIRFLKASSISLLGVLFLSASLAHISFILKVNQFAGVKLSYVLPLIIITIYYIRTSSLSIDLKWLPGVKKMLEMEVKVKHLLLIGVLGLIGYIYIGRTGNNPLVPVSNLEVKIRSLLENILYIRPRFKEFLIGHPFFILSLGLVDRFGQKLYYYPLIILAAIGQINILNTFSHIHTPIIVSSIRVFHGLWLGILLGVILLVVVRYLLLLWEKNKGKYHV